MKAFRASAAGGFGVTADTPRQAALALFDKHPEKRKCDVIADHTEPDDEYGGWNQMMKLVDEFAEGFV